MCDQLIVEHRNEEVLQEPKTSHSTSMKDLVLRIWKGVNQTGHVNKSENYNTERVRTRHVKY